jgi:hypothetical protein
LAYQLVTARDQDWSQPLRQWRHAMRPSSWCPVLQLLFS